MEMDNEMLDRIATVVRDGVCSGDSSWDEIAFDVVKAMREPTYAMRHADDVKEWPEDATACWHAMIDSIVRGKWHDN